MSDACLVIRSVGRLLIIRQNQSAPTNDDWDVLLRVISDRRAELKDMRAICFTDGGGPTVEQRKRLALAMGGNQIQSAVMCDLAVVRFVVSTISLFNKSMRTYSWRDLEEAYTWLGLRTEERLIVEESIPTMSAQVRSKRSHARAVVSESPPLRGSRL
jgi:hypothetical protein